MGDVPRHAFRQSTSSNSSTRVLPQRFAGELLKAEISEKQARSIKYQQTIAKLLGPAKVTQFAQVVVGD